MKIDKTGKIISALVSLAFGAVYMFGGVLYELPHLGSDIIWGGCVFFMCLSTLTEEL